MMRREPNRTDRMPTAQAPIGDPTRTILEGFELSRVVRGVVVRRVREMRETVVPQQVSIRHPDIREQQQQQLHNDLKLGLR
jgi:hypothetical protein